MNELEAIRHNQTTPKLVLAKLAKDSVLVTIQLGTENTLQMDTKNKNSYYFKLDCVTFEFHCKYATLPCSQP